MEGPPHESPSRMLFSPVWTVFRIYRGVRFVCSVAKRKVFRLLINREGVCLIEINAVDVLARKKKFATCPINCVTPAQAIAQNAECCTIDSNCKTYELLFMKTCVCPSTSRTSTDSFDCPSSSQLVRLSLVAQKFRTAACSCCASSRPV